MLQVGSHQAQLAAGDRRGHGEHAGVDPVGHHRVLGGGQLADAVDGDEAGAAAADLRPHLGQERDHVEHLGLGRGVVDHRGARGERRRHDQVLGARVRGGVQVQVVAVELPGLDVDLVPGLVHRGAEPGEPPVVEVEVAAAQVAAADALDDRLAQPVQQGGNEDDRAPEAAGDLRRENRAGQGGRVNHQGAFRLVELDHRADRLRQLDRPAHVLDGRYVAQYRPAFGRHERGRDHLERGVLGALHEDGALQRYAALHAVAGLRANGHGRATPVPRVPTGQSPRPDSAAGQPGADRPPVKS